MKAAEHLQQQRPPALSPSHMTGRRPRSSQVSSAPPQITTRMDAARRGDGRRMAAIGVYDVHDDLYVTG